MEGARKLCGVSQKGTNPIPSGLSASQSPHLPPHTITLGIRISVRHEWAWGAQTSRPSQALKCVDERQHIYFVSKSLAHRTRTNYQDKTTVTWLWRNQQIPPSSSDRCCHNPCLSQANMGWVSVHGNALRRTPHFRAIPDKNS